MLKFNWLRFLTNATHKKAVGSPHPTALSRGQKSRGSPPGKIYFFFFVVGLAGFFGLFLAAVVIGLRQQGIAATVCSLLEIISTPSLELTNTISLTELYTEDSKNQQKTPPAVWQGVSKTCTHP